MTLRPATTRRVLRRLALLGAGALLAGSTVLAGASPPDAGIEPVAADLFSEPVLLEADPVVAADEPQMGLSRIPVSVALTKVPSADPFAQVEFADEADGAMCLSYPVAPGRYRTSSPYGYRIHPIFGSYSMHAGVDFAAPLGTPIHAVTDGTVVYTGAGRLGRSSELVILEHTVADTTFYSWYVHMYPDGVFVEVGQRVRAGEVIAEVGNNGNSTGPHLHFEIHTADAVRSEVARTPTAMVTSLGVPDPADGDGGLEQDEERTEEPGDEESGESTEDESQEPEDESEEPGDGSGEPGDGSEEPGDGSEEPGDDSEEPGDGSGEPGDGSEEPGDGSEEPGDDSGEPGDESGEPGDGSGESDEESAEGPSGDETDEPTERPTDEPTEEPQPEPTEQPTNPRPTEEPTDQPSEDRTEAPTAVPTDDPAAEPSAGADEQRPAAESARRSFPVRAFGTTVEPMDFLRSLGLVMVAPDQCFTP